MVKTVHLILDEELYNSIIAVKRGRTWKEFIEDLVKEDEC